MTSLREEEDYIQGNLTREGSHESMISVQGLGSEQERSFRNHSWTDVARQNCRLFQCYEFYSEDYLNNENINSECYHHPLLYSVDERDKR